jgi:hypothetical protein
MRITPRSRRRLVWQTRLTLAGFLVVIALLGSGIDAIPWSWDWRTGQAGELSPTSRRAIDRLSEPLRVEAFVAPDTTARTAIRHLVERYRRHAPGIELVYLNPYVEPEALRTYDIGSRGALILHYRDRWTKVERTREAAFTRGLQQLTQDHPGRIAWHIVPGDGPTGPRSEDYQRLTQTLSATGYRLRRGPDTARAGRATPPPVRILVSEGPELPDEVFIQAQDWITRGRSLLWLWEPGPTEDPAITPLAEWLGLHPIPGRLTQPGIAPGARSAERASSRRLQLRDHPANPLTAGLEGPIRLRDAWGIRRTDSADAATLEWTHHRLLQSPPGSRIERDPAGPEAPGPSGTPPTSPQEGPIPIGWILRPQAGATNQPTPGRVIVIGDRDFVSDPYLAEGSHRQLILTALHWLATGTVTPPPTPPTPPDARLDLPTNHLRAGLIGFVFLLPGVFLGLSGWVWWRRQRR